MVVGMVKTQGHRQRVSSSSSRLSESSTISSTKSCREPIKVDYKVFSCMLIQPSCRIVTNCMRSCQKISVFLCAEWVTILEDSAVSVAGDLSFFSYAIPSFKSYRFEIPVSASY